ncbi:MAG: TonB-dependent receptor [Bacteroidota bacterium]
MKRFIYIIIFALFTNTLFAQNQISGTIKNIITGETIPGVNIYIPEIQKGTISDENGFYSLKSIPKGKFKIRFSFVGYSTVIKTVEISDQNLELNINLSEETVLSEEIVVSGGSFSTQHENAIKIESLKSSELKSANSASFIEAIAKTPGVDMISKGLGIGTPVIRGLSLSNVLMLNNGIRLENFQFSENHPFMVNESGIDRVEVIKGPASLLYGSDAIGGVINIIDEQPAASNKISADFESNYYSNTNGVNGSFGIKGTNDDFFWIVRSGAKSHMDYTDGVGQQVPNSRFNTASVKFNTGFNKSYGKFSVRYNYDKMKLGVTILPAIALTETNSRENKFWYQDLNNHVIAMKNIFFINQSKLEFNASFQQNVRKLQGSELTPVFNIVDMCLNTISYELKSYLPLNKKIDLIVGFQGLNQQNSNREAPEHVLPDYNKNDISFLSMLQLKPSKKLNVQIGLRYDLRFLLIPEQEKSGHSHDDPVQTGDEEEHISELNTRFDNLSGSLGMTYRLSESLLVRANLASAYRAPNIAELSQDGMHGNRYEQGNRNLVPQKSYEADLSMHYHAKKLTFDIAGFYNLLHNYIYLSPTTDTTEGGIDIFRYIQGNARIYGFETGVAYQPIKWFSIKTTYAYLLGYQENGDNLPFIPHDKIKTDIRFTKKKMSFINEVNFIISTVYAFKQVRPAMFETTTSEYFLLNASLGFNLKLKKKKLNFKLFVNNLLNEQYYDHLSTLKALNYYNIGRNVGISLHFEM